MICAGEAAALVKADGQELTAEEKENRDGSPPIIDEIGMAPLLIFGNNSGDISMAEYRNHYLKRRWNVHLA